jgi:hypothetical protein
MRLLQSKIKNNNFTLVTLLNIFKMRILIFLFIICTSINLSFGHITYLGKDKGIGVANISASETLWKLENKSLIAEWSVNNHVVKAQSIRNKETNQIIRWNNNPWFAVMLKDGERLTSNDFKLTTVPIVQKIEGQSKAIKLSDRYNGRKLIADFYCNKIGLKLHWEAILKDESNYIRQQFTLSSKDSLNIDRINLVEVPKENGIKACGVVAGSPLVAGDIFLAVEHPMSQTDTANYVVSSYIKRYKPITSSGLLTYTAVWGVTPSHQIRRGYLYYLERERAVPYHQQLHYNSWYDLSWTDNKLNEVSCLDRIQTFADSLIIKRKTPMNAFLFDDGWDDNKSLWQFNKNFPNGFTNISKLAKKYNAELGVWISPWGGYDEAKRQRLEYGKKQIPPFETNNNGFSLSGPVYYKLFFDVATNFIKSYGVGMFKFDGVGAGDGKEGASASYEKDIDALLKLVIELRTIKPDLYFSLTIGTWPSPYWLFYGDAIWRNGYDTGLAGVGSNRQQWITYHDAAAYKNIVKRGPLYPLNALMYHGICIADNGLPGKLDMSDKDIADEIWSFFATGTSLQELYVNPHKLSSKNWDCLADAINWSKKNEKILADVHWIGGDPGKGEIYGKAAWSPEKSIITLRNPSLKIKKIHIDVSHFLELPVNATKDYIFKVVGKDKEIVATGKSFDLVLQPFEVKILEGYPQGGAISLK